MEKKFLEGIKNQQRRISLLKAMDRYNRFKCRGKFHLFHIPFELLPIFYYQNMANLKYLFISIIRFSNDFEDISLDFEELSHTLSYSQQFEFEDNDDGHRMKKKITIKRNVIKIN